MVAVAVATLFYPYFLTTLFTFTLLSTTTLSRSVLPPLTYTVLDVAHSIQQTHHILSINPHQPTVSTFAHTFTDGKSQWNSSSYSIELHSRESVHKTEHVDYRSLLLSRLERDSARVDALNTKLEFAIEGIDKLNLQPQVEGDGRIKPMDLTTPVVSGSSQGSGEYFSRVGVGSPAKEFYMVLDTGSDVTWIQCQPCTDCYQQTDPTFDPAGSSTYSPLPCESDQCNALDVKGCRSGRCLYQVSYGDGSFTVGDFVTETMTFGSSGPVKGIALGCGHDNEGLFVGAAGLLGLGGGVVSFTSQIKASSFSYCLVDRDSGRSSSLDFNSALPAGSVTAPLVRNRKLDTFYYVGITGFVVGGQPVALSPSIFAVDESGRGGIIVDCGTAVTRLQTQAYNALRDSFVRVSPELKRTAGVALFDTCYDFSSLATVKVPTVSFRFAGGKTLDLPAKNYLIPVDSAGTYCFAFAPTSTALSIVGNVQQQGTRVTFDLANNAMGFSNNKC